MNWRDCARAAALFTLFTIPTMAATFVVPDDATFIRKADVIVTGTVLDSWAELRPNGHIETVYRLAVDEALKGTVSGDVIEFTEFGGAVGNRIVKMVGAPEYDPGQTYLIFFDANRNGRLRTLDLVLGQFRFQREAAVRYFVREHGEIAGWSQDGSPLVETTREASAFLRTIREVVAEAPANQQDLVIAPTATDLNTGQAASKGTSAWSGGSVVSYSVGPSATGNTLNLNDGEERIIFDHPNCEEDGGECISGSFSGSGTVATAFYSGFFGTGRVVIAESDVVVQDGVSIATLGQDRYNTTMTHEIGHTLGFRHSDKTPDNTAACNTEDCTSSAIMNSSVIGGLNGNLQGWDTRALAANYADGSSFDPEYLVFSSGFAWHRDNATASFRIEQECTGPSITAQPTATPNSITTGQSSTLSVSATAGTGSLSYQWYRGNRGVTTSPVGTGASVSVSPTTTSTYWARVTDGCSSVDSNTVTVTVTAGCGGPAITQQPTASPSTITEGEASALSVSASASEGSLSYQWYTGSSGNTSSPVAGGTAASIVVSPATTTSYWVRVTDGCAANPSTNSNAVTVTVNACEPVITQQPFDRTITQGQTATLAIGISNATSVQWYQGSKPDTSSPVGTGSTLQVSPATTTTYWARVSNGCSSVDSRNVTVTVQECQEPQITAQPQSTSVEQGQSAVLSVGVTGSSPITLTWYRGERNDTSNFVGTGSSISVTPSTTSKYWVQAINDCGSDSSQAATVTIVSSCEDPVITQQPQSTTIQAGETATLSVVATGTTLSYQWYQAQGADFIAIQGATAPTYTTPQLGATAAYLVQITNSCGQVNSEQVFVNVNTCSAPVITQQPQSVTVGRGSRVELSVAATGTGPLSYQWFQGVSGTPSVSVPGATSPTLVLRATDTKSYWVKVTNECDSIDSATATVEVKKFRRRAVRRH